MRRVPRSLLTAHSTAVAPLLVGKILVVDHGGGDRRWGRITEVEAYGGLDDPASHAARGLTDRNAPMFERAGTLYVYFIYGMHWCANVVTGPRGDPQAVLLRAIEPLGGIDRTTDGPAKLCQALGIDGAADGSDLYARPGGASPQVRLMDDDASVPSVAAGPRVGISVATERPWRFVVAK